MLVRLGRGFNVSMRKLPMSNNIQSTALDLTAGLPAGFTYTRADSVAMYRNSSGNWVIPSANNEYLLDHDASGNVLGLQCNPASTNKCENVNYNMTDLTGITQSGNASASVSISTHPVHGFPTILIDNTLGGSGTASANIAGAFGNLNQHSYFSHYYVETGTGAYAFISDGWGLNKDVGTAANGEDAVLKVENFTPNNSAHGLRLNVAFGGKVHFWLNQVEELPFSTDPIHVDGTAGGKSRAGFYLACTDLPTYVPAFTEAQGTAIMDAVSTGRDYTAADQYGFFFNKDGSTQYAIGTYLRSSTNNQMRGLFTSNYTSYQNTVTMKPLKNKPFPMAISWSSGTSTAFGGAMRFNTESAAAMPTGLNRLVIGSRNTTNCWAGHIKSLKLHNQQLSESAIGQIMFTDTTREAMMVAGQSLGHYMFNSIADGTNNNQGEVNLVAEMDTYRPTKQNWAINTAEGGSALDTRNAGGTDNYWYDDVNNQDGPLLIRAKKMIDGFGKDYIKWIYWDQGETDLTLSKAEFKTATMKVIDILRDYIGTGIPVMLKRMGHRSDAEFGQPQTDIRTAQREMATENSYVHLVPVTFDLPMGDAVHLSDAGFGTQGTRVARKAYKVLGEAVSGGVDGAEVTGWTRSGTTVTVTIAHDGGTDFTPTAGVEGFRFTDNGTKIAITDGARTSATTIDLTLASTPTGTEKLYYAWGSVYEDVTNPSAPTNLVVDNDSEPLPLQDYA